MAEEKGEVGTHLTLGVTKLAKFVSYFLICSQLPVLIRKENIHGFYMIFALENAVEKKKNY